MPGKGTVRISSPAMGHSTKASARSSHGPLAYPGGRVPPACTQVSALMAFLGDKAEFDQLPEWTGSRWLQGASAAAGEARGRQWEMSYSVPAVMGCAGRQQDRRALKVLSRCCSSCLWQGRAGQAPFAG